MYRLPYLTVNEDCQILIDFEDGFQEEVGVWFENYQKAVEIVYNCVLSHNIGGYGLVGQHSRMRISVGYRHPGASGNDSLTISKISGNVVDA